MIGNGVVIDPAVLLDELAGNRPVKAVRLNAWEIRRALDRLGGA